MRKKSLLLFLMMAVAILAGCKKNNEPDTPEEPAGKEGGATTNFEAEYCHTTITINIQGTYQYLVTVNVIADGKVLDVISYENPTVTVEFPINETSVLKTEAVCSTRINELAGLLCWHKMDMAWDIQVKLGDDVIATKEYSDNVDYRSTVKDSPTGLNALKKRIHTDINREFTITKTDITGPK